MRRRARKVVAVSVATVALALLLAPPALAGGETRDFRIRTKDFQFQSVPSALRPGTHDVSNHNHGDVPHVFLVYQLNAAHEDDSTEEVLAGLNAGPGTFIPGYTTGAQKGHVFSPPGAENTGPLNLTDEGRYVYFCPITAGTGTQHFNVGMIGFIKTRP